MEMFSGLIALIIVVAFLVFFRRSAARVADYSERFIIANTAEGKVDFEERAEIVAQRLNALGPDRTRLMDLDALFEAKGVNKVQEKTKK